MERSEVGILVAARVDSLRVERKTLQQSCSVVLQLLMHFIHRLMLAEAQPTYKQHDVKSKAS